MSLFAFRCFRAVAFGGLGLLSAPLLPATGGAWSEFVALPYTDYVGALALSADGQTLWYAATRSTGGGLNPVTKNPFVVPQVNKMALANGWPELVSNDGLDNSEHDNLVSSLTLDKLGNPVLGCATWGLRAGRGAQDHSPYVFTYAPGAALWSPSVFASGEEGQWPGAPFNIVRDDQGDLMLCGNHHVLVSPDGITWTQRAELIPFCAPPPPYQPAFGAYGLPSWLPAPKLQSNEPQFLPNGPGWQTGLARMPWGELLTGGEQGSYLHSLDNGVTWTWFDPLMNQPLRDAQGRPVYRNPDTFRISQTFHAVATGDGEVMFNCKNNLGHHFFLWTASGQVIEAAAGLPSSGTVLPGICTEFVTLPVSGETYMSLAWTDQEHTLPTPTGRYVDLFRWDGSAWTLLAPPAGFVCGGPGTIVADATGLLVAVDSTFDQYRHGIYKWTPDEVAAPTPAVSIAGGDSATNAPAVTLSVATGRASLQLAASATAAHAFTCQWSARGPGPVQFSDARAVSPQASFSVAGDYVLNLRVVDSGNGRSRGASVIVHVRPAPGGAAPTIAVQPANTVIAPAGATSYALSVQASGPGPFTYQWKREGRDIIDPSARTATLTGTATAADIGATFHCIVGSPFGTVASHTAVLGHAPVIDAPPLPQTVAAGQYAVFGVAARGHEPMRWQWRLNGTDIPGATRASLAASTPGAYSVTVTNLFGSATSAAATLSNGIPGNTVALNVLPGEANACSGGHAYLDNGTPVAPSYPLGAAIPLAVERRPYGYGPVFIRWTVAGLAAGNTASFTASSAQTTALTITGPGQATPVQVTAVYRDAAALPFHALTVVNGYGSGEYREGWNPAANASAGAPVVTIEALPAPAGLVFDRWVGGAFANPTAAVTTLALPLARTTVTATYATPYAHWQTTHFGASATDPALAGDMADPDGDGMANLLEYACGRSPLTAEPVTAHQPALAAGATGLEFTFVRSLAATDLTYQVQVSDDLITWTDGSRFSALAGDQPDTPATALVARMAGDGEETIAIRAQTPSGAGGRRFLRLKIVRP